MGCPCFLEIFWLFIGKYCIANIIYLIGTLLNMAFPQYFFLCTQKNFRWLYAVGFAPSLKHWWFYQSNPVLLYGLSRTGRIARWTSSQGPVIETSQLFQCIFEIKTNVRPHYHPITSRYRHDAIKNWLDFSPFLLFFLFNNLSFILSTLKKKQSMWFHFYIHEPMCRGCIELSKGVFLLEFVKYFRCLWKTKQIWLQWTVVCLLSTMLLWFYKTYFISVNIFLNAVFQIMVDHAPIPSSLILNSFSENV